VKLGMVLPAHRDYVPVSRLQATRLRVRPEGEMVRMDMAAPAPRHGASLPPDVGKVLGIPDAAVLRDEESGLSVVRNPG